MARASEDGCVALAKKHLDGDGTWLIAGMAPPFPGTVWNRTCHGGRPASAFPPPGPFDGVLLRWPKGTAAGLATAAAAAARLAPDGTVAVVCPVDEGGKSLAGRLAPHFGEVDERYGHHARLVILRDPVPGFRSVPESPSSSFEVPGLGTFASWPGLFAHGHLDPGTALLLEHLPALSGRSVLDFGCGIGVLSAAALAGGASRVDAVDVDALAVHATRHNVPQAHVHLADGVPPGGPWDLILANPPLHTGHGTDDSMLTELARSKATARSQVALVTLETVPVGRWFGSRLQRVASRSPYVVWHTGR
jgi:16S rRNA (guanine1207-N2)-methyltransferase